MNAAIYTANTTPTAIAAGGALPLGAIIRRYGCALDLNGNGINISSPGYYKANASVTFSPTAAGPVTVSMLADGVEIPGATATATAAAAGDAVALPIAAMLRRFCQGTAALTLVVDVAGTLNNLAVVVDKE